MICSVAFATVKYPKLYRVKLKAPGSGARTKNKEDEKSENTN